MAKLRVGSIGIGGISRGVHLPGISESPDLELKAVCDINPEALKYAREKYGIEEKYCFTDYHDLINCPDVDVIDISTPNYLHFEMAMAAVEAGKPFDMEKPMTMNAEEADRLAAAVREKGIKTMVCFSYRYKAAARYARDLIAKGTIGKIYHVDAQYYQSWGLDICNTPKVWRFDKPLTGTGALGDLGSHALDLVRFITGEDYTRVVGHTKTFIDKRASLVTGEPESVEVDDFSNYMADLTGGGAATFRITRFGYGRGNYQYVEIYGEKGAMLYKLDLNGDNADTLEVCLEPLGLENHRFTEIPIPDRYRKQQMQAFADILKGCPDGLSATVEDGCINMHAVDTVVESAEKGMWLDIR